MQTGAITQYIDVAQLVLYAFWIFFAGLIFYLHREGKREGYPLDSDRTALSGGKVQVVGFPGLPAPKTYLLPHGGSVEVPRKEAPAGPLPARPAFRSPGAPLEPTGDPMVDGLGAAAYAEREDVPDPTWEGESKILPMRVVSEYSVAEEDPDPRGMPVVCLDGKVAGEVVDVWVDRSEMRALYLEVALAGPADAGAGVQTRLLPINFARVSRRPAQVRVSSILAGQFARVPALRQPDQVTLLEEDKICAYFGGGTLYAYPGRREPLL